MNEWINKQFNWYKKPTGTQRYTTLTCVRADAPAKISKIWKLVRSCTSSISLVCVTFTIATRYKECSVQLVTLETTIEHWPGERRPMPRRRPVGIQSSGPDYKMCTVCTCTGASTTLEATPQGKRENCRKRSSVFTVKIVAAPPKRCTLYPDRLIRLWSGPRIWMTSKIWWRLPIEKYLCNSLKFSWRSNQLVQKYEPKCGEMSYLTMLKNPLRIHTSGFRCRILPMTFKS